MTAPINVIARAIELAETGDYRDMQALERQLEKEHYVNPHAYVTGQLRRHLAAVCRERSNAKNR
jgi:ABC-type oligopeptide transport system substrate-binding subunit